MTTALKGPYQTVATTVLTGETGNQRFGLGQCLPSDTELWRRWAKVGWERSTAPMTCGLDRPVAHRCRACAARRGCAAPPRGGSRRASDESTHEGQRPARVVPTRSRIPAPIGGEGAPMPTHPCDLSFRPAPSIDAARPLTGQASIWARRLKPGSVGARLGKNDFQDGAEARRPAAVTRRGTSVAARLTASVLAFFRARSSAFATDRSVNQFARACLADCSSEFSTRRTIEPSTLSQGRHFVQSARCWRRALHSGRKILANHKTPPSKVSLNAHDYLNSASNRSIDSMISRSA